MKNLIITIFYFTILTPLVASNPIESKRELSTKASNYKQSCAISTDQAELDINNVRARLQVGGDMWWDGQFGRYIIPKVEPGQEEVSSIFAGGVWIGGVDPQGNLKVSAQAYGRASGRSDYWPGPLTESGATDAETCNNWDNIFTVKGEDIDLHLIQYRQAMDQGITYDESLIPESIKSWPALGNEFFSSIMGFDLPNAPQGLAPFWDGNGNNIYDPQFGDYPILTIRGCTQPEYADEMSFWIFNDLGNEQTESGGEAIGMEIQAMAFAFESNDELNDMTYYRYKLVNRASETTSDTYFGIWTDPDLGCGEDDYVGCDTTRSLMYVYNQDEIDGSTGDDCSGFVPTYKDKVPYFGIDYFRGPLAPKVIDENGDLICPDPGSPFDTIIELGMANFIYTLQPGESGDSRMAFPTTELEYYHYLSGRWRNGDPLTIGGFGIDGTEKTNFAFHDEPNEEGWSMCQEDLTIGNITAIQSTGPFLLNPGQVNELIIGVPWVPEVNYPCPDMGRLFKADDLAQGLFNSCFSRLEGPDAPDVEFISQDRKLVGILSNDRITSNNRFESFSEIDPLAPPSLSNMDASYKFEGYVVYQLRDQGITSTGLDDPEKARIVFQADRKNNAEDIFNWIQEINPTTGSTLFEPILEVEGENEGIRKTFYITEDLFTGESLINGETYYYMAIAYAFNEYQPFDPLLETGQLTPYLAGVRNIRRYSAVPNAGSNENCDALQSVSVTRLDGQGAGNNFLSISKEERERILFEQEDQVPSAYAGPIEYETSGAPIEVKILDVNNISDGRYILRFDQEEEELENGRSGWELFDANDNQSLGRATQNLDVINEQLFTDVGISVRLGQTPDAGDRADNTNGAIGQTIDYADSALEWLTPVLDNASFPEVLANYDLNYLATEPGGISAALDPQEAYTNQGSGHFAPYTLMDWSIKPNVYATPAWLFTQSNLVQTFNSLEMLNNVDIVYTNDKSKWSRCVVIETGNRYFTDAGFELDDGKSNFQVVDRPSVGKEDNDADGRPDEDGSGIGFAWFPGYAIDVETGTRLNIFFGENSVFGDNAIDPDALSALNGSDMMFNPSPQAGISPDMGGYGNPANLILGGMHYVYVTRQAYDGCEYINQKLREVTTFFRVDAVQLITWAGIGLGAPDVPMLSYSEGLIPTETVVKLRVDNPYATALGEGDNSDFPSYEFNIECRESTSTSNQNMLDERLEMISIYPNPYAGSLESNSSAGAVSIANLPSDSRIAIYSLDGMLVRQFETGKDLGVETKSTLEWDAKSGNGTLLPSGAYFIQVNVDGVGQKTLKWINMR